MLFVAGGLNKNRFFDRSRYPYKEIDTATFRFSKPVQVLLRSGHIVKGVQQSRQIVRSFAPDAIVGFGSYYTLPLLVAGVWQKVPIILHEQNTVPGKVNRLLSRFAKTTAITFPESSTWLRGKTQLVPFPLRPQPSGDPWSYFGLEKGKPTLLVFGGSQGADHLNTLFLDALPYLSDYQILHFTGKACDKIEPLYQKRGPQYCVKPFEPMMHLAMQIADLAVTRAGASTLAELLDQQTPALLIPFPYATDNHQEKNARHFVGGEVYLEKELTAEKLAEAILRFPIKEKKEAMDTLKHKQTHISLAQVIEEVIAHEE
ncbi:MAG: UDP-N-acetylglucosamine--N-acetylmuramyl-(pentapeptide) pyrophosphoryl-undecaprenol N-acetylglucosamine transferase [Chlamydiales bacterium]|nr:UDP-N-acetylglucosamine--N-acetylmuramyl-(pentapeptide) pyrophosphoryl-undecaprenol N-acetylglucosamine transferase [Chlamydiales bacterium]